MHAWSLCELCWKAQNKQNILGYDFVWCINRISLFFDAIQNQWPNCQWQHFMYAQLWIWLWFYLFLSSSSSSFFFLFFQFWCMYVWLWSIGCRFHRIGYTHFEDFLFISFFFVCLQEAWNIWASFAKKKKCLCVK